MNFTKKTIFSFSTYLNLESPLAEFWAKNISFSIILFSSGPKRINATILRNFAQNQTKTYMNFKNLKEFYTKKITSTKEKNYKSNSLDYLCAFTPTTLNGWFLFLVWYFVRSFVLLLSFVETLVCEKAREKKAERTKTDSKSEVITLHKNCIQIEFSAWKGLFPLYMNTKWLLRKRFQSFG